MHDPRFSRALVTSLLCAVFAFICPDAQSQKASPGPHQTVPQLEVDHEAERDAWFLRGRVIRGQSAAELRRRAFQSKMLARARRTSHDQPKQASQEPGQSNSGWVSLGPLPLASDASGDGFQNYNQVSGRATALAIDPADASGNTLYIGGAQGGVWKSSNAAGSPATAVMWISLTDDQATLSIGALAIQPGNTNTAGSLVLAGTGEADNSSDSYFGLGILRSTNGGSTWTLISTANSGAASFAGLGATRMAFATQNTENVTTSTVVAAMAASNEGMISGAATPSTYPGLYTSTDAGVTWTYDALSTGGASEATSATSVVYNAAAGLFFAAVRYQGFYSSPDGLNWTRLANQPGAPGLLSTAACPQSYVVTCPIFRGEISVVPGRNEMYVWFVSADSNGNPVDQGIWQSLNGGAAWTEINDSGVADCGDIDGCGVEQGFYNLALLAVPNGATATDLYAGAINLYKCSMNSINPACASAPFLNLTHAYGCTPLAAPAHVHPDQHAMAFTIPNAGADSGADLMYFANDGGIYRALNGYTGLTSGSCSGTNLFDDLNQALGPLTQFVSFSESASNANLILGGTQDNGSPASAAATSNASWGNVLSGDGGYNAIDPGNGNFFASNPDTGSGGLNIQECSSGVNCTDSLFSVAVDSGDLGGDDGGFYFPYVLDPQSSSTMLVGTCRVWSGPRSGGPFTLLSLNFDTLGTGTCTGDETNIVRSLAAGGPTNALGSAVIYATTDGAGPNNPTSPIGGNVWVTTNAATISGASSTFTNVTANGPGGSSINPNQFPISDVAIDASDATGKTAYISVMGFTGGPGHVWQTTNGGGSWIDFTGSTPNALPDSPTNAVIIDPIAHVVYAGTDVGVFESPTSAAAWTEVGPTSTTSGAFGFLPDVAVTALDLFNSGGQKLLRASTYGRGIWQFNLNATPDFQIAISNTPLTVFAGVAATLDGTLTSLNGYNNSVELSCTAGTTSPPSPCTPNFTSLTPTPEGAQFQVSAGPSAIGDYFFNVQGVGSDPKGTTHAAPVTLHVVSLELSSPSPGAITEKRGAVSPAVSFQVSVQGTFTQSVTLSCGFTPPITGAACAFNPGATIEPTPSSPVNMSATVTVPANTPVGSYTVSLQATTEGAPGPVTANFTLNVILNPDFILAEPTPFPEVNAGSSSTSGSITITPQDGFNGLVNLSCQSSLGTNSCSVAPSQVSVFPTTVTLTVNGASLSAGAYQVTLQGVSAASTHTLAVPFDVGDFIISGTQNISVAPSGSATASLSLTSSFNYAGVVNATCNATALGGTQCTLSPENPIAVISGGTAALTASLNVPNNAAPGTYKINIVLQDTSGEPSHTWPITLAVGQDFTISALSPASNTVNPGQTATYNFNVLPVGSSFTNSVALSCTGAPAPCSFSPSSVIPGNSSAAVVLTISTVASSASVAHPLNRKHAIALYVLWIALPGVVLGGLRKNKSWERKPVCTLLFVLGLAMLLNSCGGGGSNGGGATGPGGGGGIGGQQQGTVPGTYNLTVTGTSGALTHQSPSAVKLIVQ